MAETFKCYSASLRVREHLAATDSAMKLVGNSATRQAFHFCEQQNYAQSKVDCATTYIAARAHDLFYPSNMATKTFIDELEKLT